MTYVEGFIVPVPTDKKNEYRRHAAEAWEIFREIGIRRHFEAWGDDLPDGKVTDFRKSVLAEDSEEVVFSWFEYPDRAARDAANQKMMSDPRMMEMGATMPFDGKRMIMGGFDSFIDEGGSAGGYTDGFVLPVPTANREAYRAMAQKATATFREHGATRVVEAWGDDLQVGKKTDFRRAVQAQEGEQVVFSWIEWPSKEARNQAWAKVMADESMKSDGKEPFDGKRMFWGGFVPILDETADQGAD
jgi:uncharacterized protein YbaA (DUF1428 family)